MQGLASDHRRPQASPQQQGGTSTTWGPRTLSAHRGRSLTAKHPLGPSGASCSTSSKVSPSHPAPSSGKQKEKKVRHKDYESVYGFDEQWDAFCGGLASTCSKLSATVLTAISGMMTSGNITKEAYKEFVTPLSLRICSPSTAAPQ
jgi:hypothetical protein